MAAGAARLLALCLGAALATGRSDECTPKPLRLMPGGNLTRLSGGAATTCAQFAPGCPYSVPFPDFPCLVNCVASEDDCVEMNRRTPSVKRGAPWSCTTCSIKACEACIYDENGEARCAKCFDGFNGHDGEEGRWKHCNLMNVDLILTVTEVIVGFLGILLFLALVTTCIGACHLDQWLGSPTEWFDGESSTSPENLETPLVDGLKTNKDAIGQGLSLSLMSSIKYSMMRLHADKDEVEQPQLLRHLTRSSSSLDRELVDVGLGLQLFFNVQRFLIVMAVVTWLVALALSYLAPGLADSMVRGSPCGYALEAGVQISEMQLRRAKLQGTGCLVLWAILLVGTWIFHCYQLHFVESYDKCTHTAEDYTVRLEGLPETVTSEEKLKQVLEEDLRMPGQIQGVCICYNVLDLPNPEQIEEMVDRLIELDDLKLKLYSEHLSTGKHQLQEEIANDKEQLETWLKDGTLHGSGVAYVVFKKQCDVARLIAERRGIARRVFDRAFGKQGKPEEKPEDESADSQEIHTVQIQKDNSEPAGVRFMEFHQPHKKMAMNEFLWMPLRMVAYIALYGIAAHVYFVCMIKPWEDNFIVGAETNIGVKLGGKMVLLFNFAIQTVVMMDVERGGFLRNAHVDQITFVWNTVLLLVTNAYVIVQEVYRDGYRWVLKSPVGCLGTDEPAEKCWEWLRLAFQSVATEKEVGKNLVSVLTEQIMMLYVLGEVANVLMPVIFYWVALRLIFVHNVGGSSNNWFHRNLRAMLPSSSSETTITAREAEKAQILMPLLLWMEYTYIVIFPAMALVTFYLVTDDTSTVCLWLVVFSVLHYLWQRYVMLWLYGKATYDSPDSYEAFILIWGLVLSMLPPASIWWAFRRGEIEEGAFALLSMFLVFMLVLLLYRYSLFLIGWFMGGRDDGIDDMENGDPGYASIVNQYGISWWNRNPVYVLKHRHCPKLQGHEVHGKDCPCFPKGCPRENFFELGKEFRHLPHASTRKASKQNSRSFSAEDIPSPKPAEERSQAAAPPSAEQQHREVSSDLEPEAVGRTVRFRSREVSAMSEATVATDVTDAEAHLRTPPPEEDVPGGEEEVVPVTSVPSMEVPEEPVPMEVPEEPPVKMPAVEAPPGASAAEAARPVEEPPVASALQPAPVVTVATAATALWQPTRQVSEATTVQPDGPSRGASAEVPAMPPSPKPVASLASIEALSPKRASQASVDFAAAAGLMPRAEANNLPGSPTGASRSLLVPSSLPSSLPTSPPVPSVTVQVAKSPRTATRPLATKVTEPELQGTPHRLAPIAKQPVTPGRPASISYGGAEVYASGSGSPPTFLTAQMRQKNLPLPLSGTASLSSSQRSVGTLNTPTGIRAGTPSNWRQQYITTASHPQLGSPAPPATGGSASARLPVRIQNALSPPPAVQQPRGQASTALPGRALYTHPGPHPGLGSHR